MDCLYFFSNSFSWSSSRLKSNSSFATSISYLNLFILSSCCSGVILFVCFFSCIVVKSFSGLLPPELPSGTLSKLCFLSTTFFALGSVFNSSNFLGSIFFFEEIEVSTDETILFAESTARSAVDCLFSLGISISSGSGKELLA